MLNNMPASSTPPGSPAVTQIAKIGLDVPLANTFDFLIPNELDVEPGRLVIVPFGRRRVVGIVVAVGAESNIPLEKLRAIESVRSDMPAVSADLMALFQFCAAYYHAPIGQIALNAIPPMLRSVKKLPDKLHASMRAVGITSAGRLAIETLPVRSSVQRSILHWLADGPQLESALRQRHVRSSALLKRLREAGLVESLDASAMPSSFAAANPSTTTTPSTNTQSSAPALNHEQQAAVVAIIKVLDPGADGYQAFLLDGITGSGKTEVYLAAIAEVLRLGKQALVLVPEINLTPAFLRHVRSRFPNHQVAPAHSGMSNLARFVAWRSAQDGEADIVIGTRLAVFTPMPRLGIIIVDEEHDASYKQQEGVRYSARDVAVFRASQARCPIVLGSATPSIETLDNVARGRFTRLVLRERAVVQADLPTVSFVDLDAEKAPDGITQSMIRAIDETIKRGEQALVFINRRGFAPALVCGGCGWMPECRRCSARMVFHRGIKRLRCHHCGAEAKLPLKCGECASTDLHPAGQGSERIEDALTAAFPDRRIARVDRDSTRRRGSAEAIFASAEKGEIDILVGTQMLTKGHDFSKMTFVGVVNADGAVFSADFRAAERMAQQLMQVAGRAGRAQLPGRVLIQTRFVEHPVYQAVASHNYAAFVSAALTERRLMHLPPYSYLALLRTESRNAAALDSFLHRAQQLAKSTLAETIEAGGLRVWEPVTATLERKAGYVRKQLMLQADSRRSMQQFLTSWIDALRSVDSRAVRWVVDVDPVDV
ncbi:MAG: primosomal protein N' [Rhodocyclaceae bacterium]|nr:primosomal protein N' [Rhodocyclaceae bacterium]